MKLRIQPSGPLRGEIRVPGDKSISHRVLIIGSLAEGTTTVDGFLRAADCLSTLGCMKKLGVDIKEEGQQVEITGRGLKGLEEPREVLDAGNSGTTARLLMGVLAGQPFFSILTGDESLCRRPMGRVVKPLREMGAFIDGREGGGLLPVAVRGGELASLTYHMPVASAQVKSALLLAGLFASGETTVYQPMASRDHTERWLKHFGAQVREENLGVTVSGGVRLKGRPVTVPGDISSAAFLLTAAALVPGSEVTVYGVGLNPTRTGFLEVLQSMGANITLQEDPASGPEPVGRVTVRASRSLQGTIIGGDLIPYLIDEIPVLAVAAAVAEGVTEIRDAAELRVKESDRIALMARELKALGAEARELPDGLVITGSRRLKGGCCQAYGDHRLAMALAVAGLVATGETEVQGSECLGISYPEFPSTLRGLGAPVEVGW